MNIQKLREKILLLSPAGYFGFGVNKKHSSSNIYWEHTLCQALCQALWGMEICLRNSSSICRLYALVMCELISQINLLLNFQMLPVTVINMCSHFLRNILWAMLTCFHSRCQSRRLSTLALHFCEVQVDVSLQPGNHLFPECGENVFVVDRDICWQLIDTVIRYACVTSFCVNRMSWQGIKGKMQGRRNCPVVKSTCYSHRDPGSVPSIIMADQNHL